MNRKVEHLRAICVDFIMNKNYSSESLVKNIINLYEENDIIEKRLVTNYINYVIDEAKTPEEIMWCINSISHYIEFDLKK